MVTGASGYVGGRLVSALVAKGHRVRAMVRAALPEYAQRWPGAEIAAGDVLDQPSLESALDGVHTAYYLIHRLANMPVSQKAQDAQAAGNFRNAARNAGVKNIVFLGSLDASDRTRSGEAVLDILRSGPVPVTVLRASIIIGSGSASYEVIQHLVRNLPVVFVPLWARNLFQPIAISDVIRYLVGVLETPRMTGLGFDIGGKDVFTYESMMKILAEVLGKKRVFIRSPISTTQIFSYLGSLITPVPGPIVMSMMQGLRTDMVCRNGSVKTFLPFEPLGYREAIVRALSREESDMVHTRWSDAYPPAHGLVVKFHELAQPPHFRDHYSVTTNREQSVLFGRICRVGGDDGWLHSTWMWRLRGVIDRLLFGVGTARGRRSRSSLKVNDVVDFWRVESLEHDRRLLLRSEMKMPGKAWLEFSIEKEGALNRLSRASSETPTH